MESLNAVFEQLRGRQRKALIPFVMAGDPNLRTTERLVGALAGAGADLIEIGIPFSDPLADGPTIQRSATRALEGGTTPQNVVAMMGRLSASVNIPLVILSYWNPILQYGRGTQRALANSQRLSMWPSEAAVPFIEAATRAGVRGVIVPDLPVEEAAGFRRLAKAAQLSVICLAAPTSPPDRLRRIAEDSEGFIYYVSVTGTTGVRRQLPSSWWHGVRQLKRITTKPICVGFGISTAAQAKAVARAADGVIIGSALIQAIEPALRSPMAAARRAAQFLRHLRQALA